MISRISVTLSVTVLSGRLVTRDIEEPPTVRFYSDSCPRLAFDGYSPPQGRIANDPSRTKGLATRRVLPAHLGCLRRSGLGADTNEPEFPIASRSTGQVRGCESYRWFVENNVVARDRIPTSGARAKDR